MTDSDSSGGGSLRHPFRSRSSGGHHPILQFTGVSRRSGSQRNKAAIATSTNGSGAGSSDGPSKAKKLIRRIMTRQKNEANRRKMKTDLERMQRQLEQTHVDATSSNGESETEQITTSQHEEVDTDHIVLPRTVVKESAEIITSLKGANEQLEVTNQQLQGELREWKQKHAKMKKANYQLMMKMAAKARAQLHSKTETAKTEAAKAQAQLHSHTEKTKVLHSHTETTMVAVKETKAEVEDWIQQHIETKAEAEDWKERYSQMGELYDDLVEKVGTLADENGTLHAKCQQLEEDDAKHKEELAAMDGTQEECDTYRHSMEDAMQMASRVSENMENFVEDHNATVRDHEQKLASQNDKLDQAVLSQHELEKALEALKVENEVLRTQFKEAEKYWLEK